MDHEILKCSADRYEVVDYYGDRMFEGTLTECEDFVYEADMGDDA